MSTLTRHLSGSREMVRAYSRRVDVPLLGEVRWRPPDETGPTVDLNRG